MTHRARDKEPGASAGAPADVPGCDAVPGKGEFLEFLGLTLAASALVLLVVRPELSEALVHALAIGTAGLVH